MFESVRADEVVLFVVGSYDGEREESVTLTIVRRHVRVEQRCQVVVIVSRRYEINPPRRDLEREHAVVGLRFGFCVDLTQVGHGSLRAFDAGRSLRFVTPCYLTTVHVFLCRRVDERGDEEAIVLEPIGFSSSEGPESYRSRRYQFRGLIMVGGIAFLRLVVDRICASSRLKGRRRLSMFVLSGRHVVFLIYFLV